MFFCSKNNFFFIFKTENQQLQNSGPAHATQPLQQTPALGHSQVSVQHPQNIITPPVPIYGFQVMPLVPLTPFQSIQNPLQMQAPMGSPLNQQNVPRTPRRQTPRRQTANAAGTTLETPRQRRNRNNIREIGGTENSGQNNVVRPLAPRPGMFSKKSTLK